MIKASIMKGEVGKCKSSNPVCTYHFFFFTRPGKKRFVYIEDVVRQKIYCGSKSGIYLRNEKSYES